MTNSLRKAEQDLNAAGSLLRSASGLQAVVAFHAQQAVEKYLKALLVRHQVYFPKTHDIGEEVRAVELAKRSRDMVKDVLRTYLA